MNGIVAAPTIFHDPCKTLKYNEPTDFSGKKENLKQGILTQLGPYPPEVLVCMAFFFQEIMNIGENRPTKWSMCEEYACNMQPVT